jgi:hypothetical protein
MPVVATKRHRAQKKEAMDQSLTRLLLFSSCHPLQYASSRMTTTTMYSIDTFILKALLLVSILELLDYYAPDLVGKLISSYQVLMETLLEHCTTSINENGIKPLDSMLRGAFALALEYKLSSMLVCIFAIRVLVWEKARDFMFSARPAAAEAEVLAEARRTEATSVEETPRRGGRRTTTAVPPTTPVRIQPKRGAKSAPSTPIRPTR